MGKSKVAMGVKTEIMQPKNLRTESSWRWRLDKYRKAGLGKPILFSLEARKLLERRNIYRYLEEPSERHEEESDVTDENQRKENI